jgi:CubicO group peptidase (beta-lactamase class C family)
MRIAFRQVFASMVCAGIAGSSFAILDTQKFDEYLYNQKDFSGAVLVADKGRVVFEKYYGYANVEFKVPNSASVKFPIASNTKSFTATAILLLQEKELLHVNDSVCKYITGFPDSLQIHHLLTHTSGIPNYYKYWGSISECTNLDTMINEIKTWSLEFMPGSQYSYSNTGYLLLASIIEKVSGVSFAAFLKENVYSPLQMHDSGSLISEYVVKNRAYGYQVEKDGLRSSPSLNNPLTLVGSGDVYASLEDMHKWVRGLFGGRLLKKESLDLLIVPHVKMSQNSDRAHAYGWFVDMYCGKRVVEYSGALQGFLSKVMYFIDDQIAIIILTNCEDKDRFCQLCDAIPQFIYNATSVTVIGSCSQG